MDLDDVVKRADRYLGSSAASHLIAYYGAAFGGSAERTTPIYTGGWFETAGRRADMTGQLFVDPDPNELTIEDLAAPALLSVPLDYKQMKALIGLNPELRTLFARIKADRPLQSEDAVDMSVDPWAAADEAFWMLRSVDGVGRTKASKLLARKRPALLPVWDRKVSRRLGLRKKDNDWPVVQHVIQVRRSALEAMRQEVAEALDASQLAHLPLTRALDVAIWMGSDE